MSEEITWATCSAHGWSGPGPCVKCKAERPAPAVGQIWQIVGSIGHSMDRDVRKVEGDTVLLGFVDAPGRHGYEWPLNVVLRDLVLVADAPAPAEKAVPMCVHNGPKCRAMDQHSSVDGECPAYVDAPAPVERLLETTCLVCEWAASTCTCKKAEKLGDVGKGAAVTAEPGGSNRIPASPPPAPFDPRAYLCNRTMRSGLACDLIKGHETTVDHDCRVLPLPREAPKGMSEADLEAAGRAAWMGRR